MGLRKRHAALLRAALCVLLLTAFGISGSGLAIASTTGVLSGTVTDAATHQPLANVRVTAASPSGSYSGTTNARGFYSIAGVYADTYTVSFQLSGYQAASIPGVSVFADQVETENIALNKSLKVIAQVTSRGGSAYQPNQTTDTVTVTAQQIQNFQGTTFNSSETNLLISLPGATADSSGYPVIHGGREYEEGFEFEGIPYTDAYSNQFNNSLAIPTAGVSLVQLTPGGGDVASGTGGGFGSFNVVAKRGTYPAYATIGAAVGAPGFDHRLNFDDSWATPDGRWSNYMSFANSDFSSWYGQNKYPLAQIGNFYNTKLETDREWLDNLYYRFGHNNSQSLQLFMDLADHHFYQGAGGFGSSAGVCGGNGSFSSNLAYETLCFPTGDPTFTRTWAAIFGMTPNQVSSITPLYPGQSSPFESLAQASGRAPFTYFQPNQAFKFGYTNNLNSSTYLNITAYRTNAVVTFDGPSTEGSFAGDVYILQGGQTNGVTLSLQKQLSDKHLFEFGADVSHLHPIDSFRSDSFSFLGAAFTGTFDQFLTPFAFLPDDANCPLGGPGLCGYAYQAGGNGAKYPMWDQVSTVQRQDYSLYASDKWQPNARLNVQLGLRMDAATYRMPTPGIDPTTCTSLYLPVTYTPPTPGNWDPANGKFTCDATATFNFPNDAVRPKVFQPRTGISYKIGSDTAVRFTYNRAVQFVPISSVDFGEIDPNAYLKTYGKLAPYDPLGVGTLCGYPGFQVQCRSFGQQLYWAAQNWDGIAYQPARPTTSNNYQLTIEHQFTGKFLNGVSMSISPWYRHQYDTIAAEAAPIVKNGVVQVVNGAVQFGPPLLTNNGKEQATGIDFNMTRNVLYGLSAQLTATYINEFSSVIPLSSSEDFYPSISPASIAAGNMYRVGFLSPFQTTLALSYHTQSGWRLTPRYTYNIGYPTGAGLLTPLFINGTAYNIPNTNGVPSGFAPGGPSCFVDPMNPGSLFKPNNAACRGNSEAASPGGKLSPAQGFLDLTLEYGPPNSRLTYGVNVANVFNELYSGAVLNGRYQPIATGISGPLTGWSTSGINYRPFPSAWPQYGSFMNSRGVFVNVPSGLGRTFYFYIQAKV